MPRTRPTSAPLPTTAPRTPVASALARLAGQPLRARHREESPNIGQSVLGGLRVAMVELPPGVDLPGEYAGRPIKYVKMADGGQLAIVFLGLSTKKMDDIDWINMKIE
jgi:hypothetical protein